jgi:hypothetical protein
MMAFAIGFEALRLDLHGGLMCVDGGAAIEIRKDILLSPLLKNRVAWQNIKVSFICFFVSNLVPIRLIVIYFDLNPFFD